MRIPPLFASLGVAVALLAPPPAEASADELDLLKREVELLKKENEILKRENAELKARLQETSPPNPDDEVVGKVWEITFVNAEGKVLATSRFLASGGKLYNGKTQIGHFTESGTRVRVDVTDADNPRGNGVYNLVQFEKNPPGYRGMMKNTNGGEAKVILRIIRD